MKACGSCGKMHDTPQCPACGYPPAAMISGNTEALLAVLICRQLFIEDRPRREIVRQIVRSLLDQAPGPLVSADVQAAIDAYHAERAKRIKPPEAESHPYEFVARVPKPLTHADGTPRQARREGTDA